MSYASELRERYAQARQRMGMGPALPVVSKSIIGRIEGKIESSETIMRNILPSIATLMPVEPERTYRDEDEIFTDYNPLTAKAIICATAEAACVPVRELLGPRREYKLTAWRQVAFYLIVTLRPDLSYSFIGRTVQRDHTTVMHGHKKVSKNFSKYRPHIAAIMDKLPL
jgi:chromosomal replication initiation ATPase DnaA